MVALRALLLTPLTGPLALYGQASARGLVLWAEQAARLPAPWSRVQLDVLDSGDTSAVTIHRALSSAPDVFFGPYGSGPMLAVARHSNRTIWNHGGASARLGRVPFPQVINVLSPASTYFQGVLQAVHAHNADLKTVTLLHTTTGFGRDIASGVFRAARAHNFRVQALPFAPAQATVSPDRVPAGDILLVAGNFEDELALAAALLKRSWRVAAFVSAGVDEILAPLGEQREGLLGPAQWLADTSIESDEGPDTAWFLRAYRSRFGAEPPYPAVQAFASGLLFARCLRECNGLVADAAQLVAAHQLACSTLYGKFRLDPETGLQVGHQILLVQWQQGKRHVVWPPEYAQRPLSFLRLK